LSDEDDFDVFLKNKKTINKSANVEKGIKSPMSKKRFVDSNYQERQRESLELIKDTQSINLKEDAQVEFLSSNSYDHFSLYTDFSSSNKTSPNVKHGSPTKLKGKIETGKELFFYR